MTTSTRSLARAIVRSTVWTSLGTYFNQTLGFISNLILARLLPVEVYGFFSMGLFWSASLNLRPKAGLSYAAIQEKQTDGTLLGTYYRLDLALAVFSLLLSIAVVSGLAYLGYPPQVTLAVLVLMGAESITALVSPLSMALEKELQLSRLTLAGLLAVLIAYATAIALALARPGIWSLLAINSLSALLGMAGVYWVCRRRYPQALQAGWRFDKALAVALLRRGLPTGLSLTAILGFVSQYDNFLIGQFVGYTTLGLYDRAFRTAHWPNILLTTVISRIGFLTFAKVQDDLPRLTHSVRLSLWVLYTLGTPIALFLVFGADEIISILYGPAWAGSGHFLRFIAIYALVGPFVAIGFWLSVALHHTRITVLLTIAQALTLLLVGTPLTIGLGANGTLLGVGLTNFIGLVISSVYVFKQIPLSLRQTFAAPALATLITLGALVGLTRLPQWTTFLPLARLLSVGVVAGGLFGVSLIVLDWREMLDRARYLASVWRTT